MPKKILIISLICAFAAVASSFIRNQNSDFTLSMRTYAKALSSATKRFHQTAEAHKLQLVSPDSLKASFIELKAVYKRTEALLEFLYPSYIEEHINGAPLLHTKRHTTSAYVVPPEGIQVLDELIFGEDPKGVKEEIALLSQQLDNKMQELLNGFAKKQLSRSQIASAIRFELIRILSLSLTGFDSPASLMGLQDAKNALSGIEELYQKSAERIDKPLLNTLKKAKAYLNDNQDFDKFDRLHFLRAFLNPIYKDLSKSFDSFDKQAISSVDLDAEQIFSPNFLNPYFFTELKETSDSPALRKLGEKLFFDPYLSQSGKLNCASCHNPQMAYTDGQTKSKSALLNKTVERNAPTLLNAVYADRYFYDLRAFSLEQQAEHVIFNELEYNTAYQNILDKLNSKPEYKPYIQDAFKKSSIDRLEFSSALASYVLSLKSWNSPFDQYVRNEKKEIDQQVKDGFNLFMGKAACGTCHFAPNFSGLVPPRYAKNETEILGVLESPYGFRLKLDPDLGRLENGIQNEAAWIYERSFKTPTIRNIELTAPYFHNGAYQNLEQVVDFYNKGGGAGMGLDVKNQTLPSDSLHLDKQEQQALIAFMKSLTELPTNEDEH